MKVYDVLTFKNVSAKCLSLSLARELAKEWSEAGTVAFIKSATSRVTLKYVDGHVSFKGTVRSPNE